jgi:hypothetical protein
MVRPMPSTADAALLPLRIISPDDLPRPAISERDLGTLALLRALRTNGLATYSARTYTETRLHRRLLGRDFFLLSDPADIDHVLNRHIRRLARELAALSDPCGSVAACYWPRARSGAGSATAWPRRSADTSIPRRGGAAHRAMGR